MSRGKTLERVKGLFRFGSVPLDEFKVVRWFISHGCPSKERRDAGCKSGFEQVHGQTIEEIVNDEKWSWVADDIYRRCCEIKERIENARGKKR